MDYAACNVVYVDRTSREDRLVKRDDATTTATSIRIPDSTEDHASDTGDPDAVDSNLQTLLGTFSEGSLQTLTFLTRPPANTSQSMSVPLADPVYQSCPN